MAEYIERREAIDAIVNCTNCGTPDELRKYVDKHSLENGWTGGILDAMGAVEDMPAADVVQIVHARWMPQKGGGLRCSECGHYALDEPDGNFIHVSVPSEFCPHCGVKMDGERRSEQDE